MLSGNLRAVIKKDYSLYHDVKSVQVLQRSERRNFGQDYMENFKSYQDRFTVAHITQLDVLTFKNKYLNNKMTRLRRFLKKEKILDEQVINL